MMMAFSFRAGTNWCHDFPKLARESGFYFNMHRTRVRVDWNRISSIDIDQVIRERDFLTIDENVNNVVDYSLESEYDVKILDPNFVKLFRLAQLSVEYLLYCKQYLDHSVIILKDELRSKLEENVKLKKKLSSAEESMKEMREKFKDKQKYIETKLSDSHGEIHKCPQCPKTFISAVFMNAHVGRRHPNTSSFSTSPGDEHYRAEAEKLHNEIKNLKERLNETERVIRSESEKIFDSAQSSKDLRNSIMDRSNFQDQKIEEEHRRYREEIANLKSMLFSEIRSIKENDKKSLDNFECEQSSGNWKELIRQQENEIQRLKDHLQKKSNSDLENIQSKLDAQEKFWQSKIEKIDEQHRIDIEKLYTQLKLNEKSSEEMRDDYLKKIKNLEEITKTDISRMINKKNTEVEDFDKGISDYQKNKIHGGMTIENFDNESISAANQNKSFSITVSPIKSMESRDSMRKKRDKQTRSSIVKDEFTKSSAVALRTDRWKDQQKFVSNNNILQSTNAMSTCSNNIQQSNLISPQKIISSSTKEMEAFVSPSEESLTQSESILTSENSESESEETTETNYEEENSKSFEEKFESTKNVKIRESLEEEKFENQKQSKNVERIKSDEEIKKDIEENFNQRLKDLGVDSDWQGIPHATFRQLTQIIKHHRNLSSKKFVQFDETRRKIVQDVSQKISDNKKEARKAEEIPKKSPLNKLMRNVKTKALKALSINSQENTPRENNETQKPLINKFNLELLPKKLKSPGRIVKPIVPSQDISRQPRYTSSPSRKNQKLVEPSIDLKPISHSYESIKDYLKDSGTTESPFRRLKSPLNFGRPSITSSPDIKEKSFPHFLDTKTDELRSLPNSPKSSKSVLKSTAGSVGSLVKKKVIFDLKNEEKKSSEKEEEEEEELSESDFDVSSIYEEELIEKKEVKNPENISLKISQSEKIAEISRKIETQLSLSRRKPAGAVEAMFTKKFNFPDDEDEKDSEHNDPIDFMRSYEPKKEIKLPQPAPRVSKTQIYNSNSKDLDKDIEELLLTE